jgi:hypothetical protein
MLLAGLCAPLLLRIVDAATLIVICGVGTMLTGLAGIMVPQLTRLGGQPLAECEPDAGTLLKC